MNIGDKLDDIYEAHQTNIELVLWQMIRHFQNSANGLYRAHMRSFMDSLSHRIREICQSVRANHIAELIGHQSVATNIGNELNEDDFDQITSLLDQIDQIVDSSENDEAEKVDQDNELLNEIDLKVNTKLELEANQNEFNQDKVDVETDSVALSGFPSSTLVSELDIDKFLQFRKSQSNKLVDTKKRRYSVFQESSPFFAEPVSSAPKKRRLSVGPMVDTSHCNSRNQTTKLTMKVAKQLRYPMNAILHAKSNATGQIQAFCFGCHQKLEMSFYAWKAHILMHTEEKEFYCTGCNTGLSSNELGHCMGYHVVESFTGGNDLKAFMCNICNYLQVNIHRVIDHIKGEHDNEPDDHLQQVMLLPDLMPRNIPISTNSKHVSTKKRYQCGIRNCRLSFIHPSVFKKHFMNKHTWANIVVCPHCREIIIKDSSINDFFGTVLNHLYMHGNIVNQCNACEAIFANDLNVYSHILVNHGNEPCRYRRDIRGANKIEQMHDVLTIFECALCKIHVDTSAQAIQHFLKTHKSHHADFTLLQFVKQELANGVTQYSMDTKDQIWQFQQHFTCGWCHEILTTKGRLNRHFEIKHESRQLLLEFSKNYLVDLKEVSKLPNQNLGYDQYVMYYCGHCSDLDHSISTFYPGIEEVYDHWSSTHAYNGDSKPFRFTVAPLARCRYCDVISTFAGIKQHQAEQHATKPFIFEHLIDRTKCGICLGRVNDALVKHFDTDHQVVLKANVFSPIALDGDTLKKLVDLRGHKKRKCSHCTDIFETKDECDRHHNEKHASLEVEWEKFYDNKSIHLITGCCQAKIQPNDLFRHFMEHKMLSKYRLKQYYWETMIIFGNGLVLTKHNLLGTEYDDSKEFEDFIKVTMDGK